MSASSIISARDDSDTEANVVERNGGDELPDHVVDTGTGNSITQRCRKRQEWVQGDDFPGNKDELWVCRDRNCARPVCAAYSAYKLAASELGQRQEQLGQSQEQLAQLEQAMAQASDGNSSQPYLKLLQETVDKDQKLLDKDQEFLLSLIHI